MATESFYQDLVIDTPEAAANLTELLESGVKLKRGDTVFVENSPEFMRFVRERNLEKQRQNQKQ